ncbi:MAG: calcium-binding protein [Methyloligellaceae bacterium]
MANLIGGSIEGIDIWDPSQWGFDTTLSASESVYEYETPDGNTVQIIGSGFTYDDQGIPTGGTVEVVQIHDSIGNQIASLVLGDAPFADLAANDFENFWPVLLAGDDVISTGHNADILSGNDGNDMIWGAGGDDTIFGGAGNDTLNGGNGDDTVYGGSGDDTIVFNVEDGDDRIFGGAGEDTVVHNGLTSDWPDLIHISKVAAEDGGIQGGAGGIKTPGGGGGDPRPVDDFKIPDRDGGDTRTVDGLKARTDFSDGGAFFGAKAVGSSDDAFLAYGGGGLDDGALFQFMEQDAALDGAFKNTSKMAGGADFNVLLEVGSSTGNDNPDEPERNEATISDVEFMEINTGNGNDDLDVGDLTGTDMENGRIVYDGGAGSDDLDALGTSTAITYLWRFAEGEGHPGGGTVKFGGSTDDLFHVVDEAHDGLSIDLGLNFIGTAVDVDAGVSGGGFGGDVSLYNVEQMVFDFGNGDDQLVVTEDLGSLYGDTLYANFGGGEASLIVFNHSGRIEAIGGDVHNDFTSGDGNDLLVGGAGHDYIFGAGGNDEIIGGADDDELVGSAGDDTISGGAGGDRFFFEQGSGTDTITDFVAGDAEFDRLDFMAVGTSFKELNITQMGDDTHVQTIHGDTVILENVIATDLNGGDFLF